MLSRIVRFDGAGDFYLATFVQTVSSNPFKNQVFAAFLVPRGKEIVVTDGDFQRLSMSGHMGENGLKDCGLASARVAKPRRRSLTEN